MTPLCSDWLLLCDVIRGGAKAYISLVPFVDGSFGSPHRGTTLAWKGHLLSYNREYDWAEKKKPNAGAMALERYRNNIEGLFNDFKTGEYEMARFLLAERELEDGTVWRMVDDGDVYAVTDDEEEPVIKRKPCLKRKRKQNGYWDAKIKRLEKVKGGSKACRKLNMRYEEGKDFFPVDDRHVTFHAQPEVNNYQVNNFLVKRDWNNNEEDMIGIQAMQEYEQSVAYINTLDEDCMQAYDNYLLSCMSEDWDLVELEIQYQ